MKILLLLIALSWAQAVMGQGSPMQEHKMLGRLQKKPLTIHRAGQARDRDNAGQEALQVEALPKIKKGIQTPVLPDSVGPLLPDQWDQEGPLRSMTPMLDGEHCVVGCVALAMAQVMHRWQYPEWGTGSFTYDDSLGCGQVLTADFYQHRYDWANMPDRYVEGEYTQEQADAGALLCSDCGISVAMRYGRSSGAQPVQQAIALPAYFGYDEGVQIYFRDFYSEAEITQMLKQELAAGRPVLVSGYNYGGGHAFVIDGYNKDDWFHINVGNPDREFDGDGWTPLSCMSPHQPAWYDVDRPESGYNLLQIFVLGVVPRTHADARGQVSHVYAMHRMDAVKIRTGRGDSLQVCVRDLSNVGRSLHTDSVSIMLLKGSERLCPVYTYDREFLLEEVDDTTYTDTLSIPLPQGLAEGQYALLPMFRDGGQWQEVRTSTGTPNYLLMDVEADSVALYGDSARMAYATLEDYEIPDFIVNGTCPELSLTLKGHNAELSGRIYLLLESRTEEEEPVFLIRQGITLKPGEETTYRFLKTRLSVPKTGTYRLHVVYDNSLFADELFKLTDEPIEVTFMNVSGIQIAEK